MKKIFFLIVFFSLSPIIFAANSEANNIQGVNSYQGNYHINIILPGDMHWTLYQDKKGASGYTKIYLPRKADNFSDQNITVTYDGNNQNSLQESMQEVLDALNQTDCQLTKRKILERLKNHITFAVNLDQCSNNKSIIQIFKIYDADDGQYSIVYTADTTATEKDTINKMQNAIIASRLIS